MADATPYSDQTNWSNDYLTDPKLLKLLGPFDTDPCCPPKMPWRTAKLMMTNNFTGMKRGVDARLLLKRGRKKTVEPMLYCVDGLTATWHGRVFMNPPYRGVVSWAKKFAANGYGIALLNGRSTETKATQIIMAECAALWLPLGRLTFYKTSGKPWEQKWFPSLLIGMTRFDLVRLKHAQRVYGGTILIGPKLQ